MTSPIAWMIVWLAILAACPPAAAQGSSSCAVVMRVTAYCPCQKCCGPNAGGITASGRLVTTNGGQFVAADKSVPFGTRVIVPGYAGSQPVPVLDRGGAIRGDRLDVFFPSHTQAQAWGVRWLRVTFTPNPLENP
jgi:3D (Asp-Asp-Asp) domain-containing protein